MTPSLIHEGDALEVLRTLADQSARCCVTSPPYWGLRDYGVPGQLGLESTPDEYVAAMVSAFREVRRVLADDGTLWLNLGDSYAGSWGAQSRPLGGGSLLSARQIAEHPKGTLTGSLKNTPGLKAKDLVGIPWMVAFALRADGWYLRSDIIWSKPNPMPESVTDRPTKAHEYLFLLTKSARYYYDAEAIAEPIARATAERLAQPNLEGQWGSDRVPGKTNGPMKAVPPRFGGQKYGDNDGPEHRTKSGREYVRDVENPCFRNRRTVWTVATQPFSEAHFATFPPKLIEPCVKAGSAAGDTVLDPFSGAGTTGLVASRLGRAFVGIELNPKYAAMARCRIINDAPLLNQEIV